MVLRSAIIGSQTATNLLDILISISPEIILSAIFLLVFYKYLIGFKFSKFDILLALFFISNVIIGLILSDNLKISVFGFRLTYLPIITYFIVRFNKSDIEKEYTFDKILTSISRWYVVAAIIGLLLYFVFPNFEQVLMKAASAKNSYYYVRRMGGLFLSPVVWGTFCSITGLYMYIKYSQTKKISHLLGYLILWFCMILSVSRGAIVPFYIGLFLLTISFKWYRQFIVTTALSVIIFVSYSLYEPLAPNLIGFVSSSSVETIDRISSDEAANVISDEDTADVSGINNTRAKFWALSLRSFKKNPCGYGLGKAGHVANKYKSILKDSKNASIYSTDGWYLKLINETGVWGGITYFVLFISIAAMCYKNYKRLKNNVIFLYCLVVFIIVAIQNIVSNVLDFYSFPHFLLDDNWIYAKFNRRKAWLKLVWLLLIIK